MRSLLHWRATAADQSSTLEFVSVGFGSGKPSSNRNCSVRSLTSLLARLHNQLDPEQILVQPVPLESGTNVDYLQQDNTIAFIQHSRGLLLFEENEIRNKLMNDH